MEFRHLRYFLVLAEELHFGRAAQRLAITQPPLSLNIQQLEASVGTQLLLRNSRGVQLTPAGQAFVPAARSLLAQAAAARHSARDAAAGLLGQLQVGFAGTVLYRGLPQILRHFAQTQPRLRLVLKEQSSSDQLIDLVHGRLDLGFVHTTRVPMGFSQILVSSQSFVVCLAQSHPLAAAPHCGLAALAGLPFAAIARAVSPDYHERILGLCADAGFEPELRYELRHWLGVVSLVAQGLACAVVPSALQQAGLPGVVFVPLDRPGPAYETRCLWKSGAEGAAVGAFLDSVRCVAQAG